MITKIVASLSGGVGFVNLNVFWFEEFNELDELDELDDFDDFNGLVSLGVGENGGCLR